MRACIALLVVMLAWAAPVRADVAEREPRYLILVTIDGFRWEELFRGADPDLVADDRYRARYVDVADRAAALTPFLRSFEQAGVLIGNRDQGSCARVSNDYWFSYPGYAEMLAGRPNPRVRYNAAVPNDDITVLERLQRHGLSVGVFAEWDVMGAILNVKRSAISVVVPPDPDAPHDPQVIEATRSVLNDPPRVLYLALGDTDNRAHEGQYEAYLAAASEADTFLREVWDAYQTNPRTAGRTTMIVTSDHGRGAAEDNRWTGHGSGRWRRIIVPGLRHEGSDAIFIAARGPDIVGTASHTMETCATLAQVAATMLRSVHLHDELAQPDMAPALNVFAEE
ncbi:MAG: alkaline phosphatase family protein [Hyphomonadaceae bacterium]|nr:alkaline phosphatase family protein [Hyphomonadaceae bacterium]